MHVRLSVQAALPPALRLVQELVEAKHVAGVLFKLHGSFADLLLLGAFEANARLAEAEAVVAQGLADALLRPAAKGLVVPVGDVAPRLVDGCSRGRAVEERTVIEAVGFVVAERVGEGLLVEEAGVEHGLF